MLQFLQSLATRAPSEARNELEALRSREQRAALAKLIEAAGYGQPTHLAYPEAAAVQQVASHARAGCIPAGDKSQWDRARKSASPLAQLIVDMMPHWHALMWHWAVPPATVLNEIYLYAKIAAARGGQGSSEALAVCYAECLRKKVEKLSQRTPFTAADQHFDSLQEMFFERNETVYSEAKELVAACGPGAHSKREDPVDKFYCLHYQLGTCSFKGRCDKRHMCPFCGSTRPGCLRDCLAKLAKPRVIVPKDPQGGSASGSNRWDRPGPSNPVRGASPPAQPRRRQADYAPGSKREARPDARRRSRSPSR